MRLYTIGADPEIFVAMDGKISSAIGSIGGAKHSPLMLNNYGLQEDNVLAEYSTPVVTTFGADPARRFSQVIERGVKEINSIIKKKGLRTVVGSSHEYSPEELNSFGPAALEFGCDPDMNAYTGEENPAPDQSSTLRTAGGHVHLGVTGWQNDDTIARMLALSMDLFVGVPSVLIDDDNRRRELYGKAGAYRKKDYGIEYRTLSNFWIHTPAHREWVFYATKTAVDNASSIHLLHKIVPAEMIQDCINTGNREMARDIMRTLEIEGVKDAQAA